MAVSHVRRVGLAAVDALPHARAVRDLRVVGGECEVVGVGVGIGPVGQVRDVVQHLRHGRSDQDILVKRKRNESFKFKLKS